MNTTDLNSLSFDKLVPSESKYLSKEDVPEEGVDLTVRGFKRETLKGDQGDEEKTILYFTEEHYKPLVLNRTNASRLALVTGAKTAGEARGKKVNVYHDPMIEFGGKLVGGVRLRKPTGAVAATETGRRPRFRFTVLMTDPVELHDDTPLGPPDEERLAWERASRAVIRRIFEAVLADNWSTVLDLYRESREQGEWFVTSIWAGLPATVKTRIRDMDAEARNEQANAAREI